jgi:hypothetical protein
MSPNLDKQLCETYPALFKNRDNKDSCMYRGFECESGWYPLINSLCSCISYHCEVNKIEVVVEQVKEKFGGLRVYYRGGDDTIIGMVRLAEHLSFNTCEQCGDSTISGEVMTGEFNPPNSYISAKCKMCRRY